MVIVQVLRKKDMDIEKESWGMEYGDMFLHNTKWNCRVHWHNMLLNMRYQKAYISVKESTGNEDYYFCSREGRMCQYIISIISVFLFS